MNAMETIDRNIYGATEVNGLVTPQDYHSLVKYDEELTLAEVSARGGKITRLRLFTEWVPTIRARVADVSYIHATLPDGSVHPVNNGADIQYYHQVKGDLIAWAKREGVSAKKLGLLDEGNWSVIS